VLSIDEKIQQKTNVFEFLGSFRQWILKSKRLGQKRLNYAKFIIFILKAKIPTGLGREIKLVKLRSINQNIISEY
jgi:hypothetical protein